MRRTLAGQVALVTGGSAGIGAACGRQLAAAGARVILVARGQARLDDTVEALRAEGGEVEGWVADMGDDAACTALIERISSTIGRLDILVNNAGLHHRGAFQSHDPDRLADMVDINLRSPIRLTRLALPLLRETQGAVVNVASLAGCVPVPGSAVYSATKFGLRAFSLALAQELQAEGVSVSLVSPGPVDTGFIMDHLDEVTDITFSQPIVTAEEVACCVLRCVSSGAAEIKLPRTSGWLANVGYLLPFLKRWLYPLLKRKGARVRARLLASAQEEADRS